MADNEKYKGRLSLKGKLYSALVFICVVMLCCWGVFCINAASRMQATSETYIAQVSDRVIANMEDTFLNLEHIAIAISSSDSTKSLLMERDPLQYYQKAGEVRKVLGALYQSNGLVDDILIYDMEGTYCRLRGTLGNTAAKRVQLLLNDSNAAQHIAVTLEGTPYIGYITGVFDDDKQAGYMVFLMKSSQLQKLFLSYDDSGSLYIGLAADDIIVASNDGSRVGEQVPPRQSRNSSYTIRHVGLTPFQILVIDHGEAVKKTLVSFFVASLVTIFILMFMVLLFYRTLNRLFFRPMLGIIDNARHIGTGVGTTRLANTGQEDFDQLVQQINSMVSRIDENSRTLFQMQYTVQNAELEKQQAIIISLKKQINAHFTVNTLNVVRRFTELGESGKAGIVCDGLSALLRYANGADEFINCHEELQVLEQFVEIMSIRYPDRFTAEFECDDRLESLVLPRMLVQPIVENAISHGLLTTTNGHLQVSARTEGDLLVFTVADSGKGMTPQQLTELRERIQSAPANVWGAKGLDHIALPNIQKRVVSMFGEGYGLQVESTQGSGTTVSLTLPIRREQ